MGVKSCRVTICDQDGVEHTVEVTAGTLYEAVALGLRGVRGDEWVAGIVTASKSVVVKVCDVSIEHKVRLDDFTKWLERRGKSPREVIQRQKVREILGMGVER